MDERPLLQVRDLRIHIPSSKGVLRPVDGVSLKLEAGETLGIVGESGCGKSLLALSLMRLLPEAARVASGEILLRGENLLAASEERLCGIRGLEIAVIFQEPMTALNPVFTIGYQIAEGIMIHKGLSKRAALEEAVAMLDRVAIRDPRQRAGDYPHQLSGGMRQRVLIAMALVNRPSILVADEPTTALDASIQSQILDLLQGLQEEMGLAIILVSHDLAVIARMARRVAVMYCGRFVEEAPLGGLFDRPAHPYTRGLLASIPRTNRKAPPPLQGPEGETQREHAQPPAPAAVRAPLFAIEGSVPELSNLPVGCSFHPRCPESHDRCRAEEPMLSVVAALGPGRTAACFLHPGTIGVPVAARRRSAG